MTTTVPECTSVAVPNREEDFGGRVKRLRLLVGLKGRQLDALAGLQSSGLVNQIERKPRPQTSAAVVAAIADVFGVSSDYLFRGVGTCPADSDIIASVDRARRRASRKTRKETGKAA